MSNVNVCPESDELAEEQPANSLSPRCDELSSRRLCVRSALMCFLGSCDQRFGRDTPGVQAVSTHVVPQKMPCPWVKMMKLNICGLRLCRVDRLLKLLQLL